ncbi:hypothetical protein [Streptacidiphilus sp. MAP12-33]|uniref:hypothetical protein n=1 Tax=Streptacidiphilus sp. MAP12-33 TaxID=3156266 RepID=UPI00351451B2
MRHRPAPRRRLLASAVAAALAALTALTAAACSSGAEREAATALPTPPGSASAAVALAAQKAGGYRSVTVHATDTEWNGTATMTGHAGRLPLTVDLRYRLAGFPTMPTVFADGALYQEYPQGLGSHFGYRHWVVTVLAGPGASPHDQQTAGDPALVQDPWTVLRLLGSARSIQRVGQETVDGVPAWHYRGVADLAALAPAPSPSVSGQDGVSRTVDAWIGADGLPVRMLVTTRMGTDVYPDRIDYSGFSTSPSGITAPPADDTITEAQFLGG